MRRPPEASNQIFNNADSFAQAFDEAWNVHSLQCPHHGLSAEAKMELILAQVADHPFQQSDPVTAQQVAAFRIRLLGL
jgi:hypothetical protein